MRYVSAGLTCESVFST